MSVRSAEVTALARTCCVAAKIDVGVSILNGLQTTYMLRAAVSVTGLQPPLWGPQRGG